MDDAGELKTVDPDKNPPAGVPDKIDPGVPPSAPMFAAPRIPPAGMLKMFPLLVKSGSLGSVPVLPPSRKLRSSVLVDLSVLMAMVGLAHSRGPAHLKQIGAVGHERDLKVLVSAGQG